ncbi:hypothetical protein PSHT_12107 [Puccinia striiformis]|uniref:Uncharacterized protein n=1 Tax=Puccinia striiformis TaxID=27350 RepID=A0A2S4UZ40_9BASI|nr:hypothetical protein PSHT_12107 [Puccinia striiformis]
MAEIYLANSDDGMSKLGSPILPDRGPFNALRESLPSLEPTRKNQREPNTGVTPMEINSRATSLALRSGMSTPVPLPVDRLTVPPTDQPLSKDREMTTDPENTHPSNLAPIVDNKHLEMYINMFYSQKFMYEEARKNEDRVVMIAALNQAISSQELMLRIVSGEEMMSVCENWLAQAEMDIMFPKEQAAKDRISTATQASTPTPIHQTRSPSPQEDVAMVHRDPTPVQAMAHSASSILSAHQITQNHAQRVVQHTMNVSNYVNQTAQQAPHQNLVPNYAPAPTFAQNQNSATNDAPVQNFGSNYAMPSQQNHNQATYEHPRPPQHQQGLPGTSHQAGPTSINRPVHRTRRDRFHYNRNEPAAPQPHPPPQQRPAPYPVQHQPGGNSGGSRRRRRNPQPQDNTARVLEVGDVFLRAERILGRMQRVQGRKNAQNRNHPNQHYHQ